MLKAEILNQLMEITEEEKTILAGNEVVEKSRYTSKKEFIIDSKRMLEKGKLMDVRTHTRFVHFPKHRHNYVEIIYMCSGKTTHIINDTSRVLLETGDLLFLNQNAYQEILPAKQDDIAINFIVLPEFFDVAFKMIEGENSIRNFFIGSLQKSSMGVDYIHFKVANILPVQNLVENMIWSILNKQVYERNINQTTMGLLFLQLSNYTNCIDQNDPNQYEQNRMFAVLRYIEENYRQGTLTELAEISKQSFTGLSRFIKKHSGFTFKELVQQKRLSQAIFLLSTTKLTVDEIILAVGYDNTSYFYRIFKEKYDITPKKYREENGRNKDSSQDINQL